MHPVRLAVVSTHPIQYYAPLFAALARSPDVQLRVFYTWSQTAASVVKDVEFGQAVSWDIPLRDGYDHEFVENVAQRPGTDHFFGLCNPALNRAVTAWRPDALLVFTWNSWSHLRVLMHFKGRVPVLFRGDSTLLDRRSWWRGALRGLALRWVYRHVDIALAVGANNRDYFRAFGLPDRSVVIAPHAVDTQRFAAAEETRGVQARQWRAALGIPVKARVVLFAGKFIAKKDPLGLLQAFMGAVAEQAAADPAHLVFVGGGELDAELRQQAQGRTDVHFVPFQNQQAMPVVYRLADLYVLPSLGPGETWGLAMNEALACGTLVVASDKVGGARDVIEEGVTGWSFPAGDTVALSRCLRTVIDLPEAMLATLKTAARERSHRWSIEATAATIGRTVRQAIRPSPGP